MSRHNRLFKFDYPAVIEAALRSNWMLPEGLRVQNRVNGFPVESQGAYGDFIEDFKRADDAATHEVKVSYGHLCRLPKGVDALPARGGSIPGYTYDRYDGVLSRLCPPFSGSSVPEELWYPAVTIRESVSDQDAVQVGPAEFNVIAEGPSRQNLKNLLRGLDEANIDVLVAVGFPFEGGREKFFDYMQYGIPFSQGDANDANNDIPAKQGSGASSSAEDESFEVDDSERPPGTYPRAISAAEFFKHFVPEEAGLDLQDEDVAETNFKFYGLRIVNDDGGQSLKYVMHIPNWDDHGLPRFNTADKVVLACFYQVGPNSCFHCSAGQGRSVALLMAKMLFRDLRGMENVDMQTLRSTLFDILKAVKAVKPTAGEWYQYLVIPGLVEDILYAARIALGLRDVFAPTLAEAGIFSRGQPTSEGPVGSPSGDGLSSGCS